MDRIIFQFLCLSLFKSSVQAASCYWPNGQLMPSDQYVPCYGSQTSMCCAVARQDRSNPGRTNICRTDGLCEEQNNPGTVYREGCTDPLWQSAGCLAWCQQGGFNQGPSLGIVNIAAQDTVMTNCGGGRWCCGFNNTGCCQSGGFYQNNMNQVVIASPKALASSTPAPQPQPQPQPQSQNTPALNTSPSPSSNFQLASSSTSALGPFQTSQSSSSSSPDSPSDSASTTRTVVSSSTVTSLLVSGQFTFTSVFLTSVLSTQIAYAETSANSTDSSKMSLTVGLSVGISAGLILIAGIGSAILFILKRNSNKTDQGQGTVPLVDAHRTAFAMQDSPRTYSQGGPPSTMESASMPSSYYYHYNHLDDGAKMTPFSPLSPAEFSDTKSERTVQELPGSGRDGHTLREPAEMPNNTIRTASNAKR